MRKPKLPPILVMAGRALETLPGALSNAVFDEPGRVRSMRSQFRRTLRLVLRACLKRYDLATGQLVKPMTPGAYVALTPAHVAKDTGLSVRTVCRAFRLLKRSGCIDVEDQQIRKVPTPTGTKIVCASVIRRLSDKFFAILGLLAELQQERAGKLNSILAVRRQAVIRGLEGIHKGKSLPVPQKPAQEQKRPPDGSASLRDKFREMAAMGIPVAPGLLN